MSRKPRAAIKRYVIVDLLTNEYLVNKEYDYNSSRQNNSITLEFSKIVDNCELYTKYKANQFFNLWTKHYILIDKNTGLLFNPNRFGIKEAKSITVLV